MSYGPLLILTPKIIEEQWVKSDRLNGTNARQFQNNNNNNSVRQASGEGQGQGRVIGRGMPEASNGKRRSRITMCHVMEVMEEEREAESLVECGAGISMGEVGVGIAWDNRLVDGGGMMRRERKGRILGAKQK